MIAAANSSYTAALDAANRKQALTALAIESGIREQLSEQSATLSESLNSLRRDEVVGLALLNEAFDDTAADLWHAWGSASEEEITSYQVAAQAALANARYQLAVDQPSPWAEEQSAVGAANLARITTVAQASNDKSAITFAADRTDQRSRSEAEAHATQSESESIRERQAVLESMRAEESSQQVQNKMQAAQAGASQGLRLPAVVTELPIDESQLAPQQWQTPQPKPADNYFGGAVGGMFGWNYTGFPLAGDDSSTPAEEGELGERSADSAGKSASSIAGSEPDPLDTTFLQESFREQERLGLTNSERIEYEEYLGEINRYYATNSPSQIGVGLASLLKYVEDMPHPPESYLVKLEKWNLANPQNPSIPSIGAAPQLSEWQQAENRKIVAAREVDWAFKTPGDPDAAEIRARVYGNAGTMFSPYLPAPPREDLQKAAELMAIPLGPVGAPILGANAGIHAWNGEYEEAAIVGAGAVSIIVPWSRLLRIGAKGTATTFRDLLTETEISQFNALKQKYPDFMPDLDAVAKPLTPQEVQAARLLVRGRGHHRHPLAFDGAPNPDEGLVPTFETRVNKNKVHTEVSTFWYGVLRRLRDSRE